MKQPAAMAKANPTESSEFTASTKTVPLTLPRRARHVWAVFVSGRGSNLAALLDLQDEIDIGLVVTSDPSAYACLRARRAGVRVLEIPRQMSASSKNAKIDWAELVEKLCEAQVTAIFLAGFMKIVPQSFLLTWSEKRSQSSSGNIINLHPSLLPNYPGLNSIARAFNDAAPLGASVHQVTAEVDGGLVLAQRRTWLNKDSLSKAEFLVHIDEQRLVREVVRKYSRPGAWP